MYVHYAYIAHILPGMRSLPCFSVTQSLYCNNFCVLSDLGYSQHWLCIRQPLHLYCSCHSLHTYTHERGECMRATDLNFPSWAPPLHVEGSLPPLLAPCHVPLWSVSCILQIVSGTIAYRMLFIIHLIMHNIYILCPVPHALYQLQGTVWWQVYPCLQPCWPVHWSLALQRKPPVHQRHLPIFLSHPAIIMSWKTHKQAGWCSCPMNITSEW